MPHTISVQVYEGVPGCVRVVVTGTPGVAARLWRVDGTETHPVRNFTTTGNGLEEVIDTEAPLGRPVSYRLTDVLGDWLASSALVECPAPADGRSLLRSVLAPQVQWAWAEPQDEKNVEWATSTTVHRVVGSDTPVVVGEVRQRHSGIITFLCKSIAEADRLVAIMRDGAPLLLRHSPCAGRDTRDMLFYALDVTEARVFRSGWRLLAVEYQTTRFVVGDTEEPPSPLWTFGDLRDTGLTFGQVRDRYATFADLAMNLPKPGVRDASAA
jgi:hypothetical protein